MASAEVELAEVRRAVLALEPPGLGVYNGSALNTTAINETRTVTGSGGASARAGAGTFISDNANSFAGVSAVVMTGGPQVQESVVIEKDEVSSSTASMPSHEIPPRGWQDNNTQEVAAEIASRYRDYHAGVVAAMNGTFAPPPSLLSAAVSFSSMSLKELILRALVDNFPEGATTQELREFLANAYRRIVDRTSLSPQISRLYADNIVQRGQEPHSWKLNPGVTERLKNEYGILVPTVYRIDPSEVDAASPPDEDEADS
jgi:hypothetical protein